MLALSWVVMGFSEVSLIALIIGIVILDLAIQAVHISNMNVIYALDESARNRLNSGYMFVYFLGGAGGSLASAWVYQHYQWNGVVGLGLGLAAVACLLAWLTPAETSTSAS